MTLLNAFSPLVTKINANISESSPARARIQRLDGESLAIEVKGFGLAAVLLATADELVVAESVDDPSATVAGSPLDFLRVLRRDSDARTADLEIAGDAEIAEEFWQLLTLAKPDLDLELANLIGAAPAGELLRFAENLNQFMSKSWAALVANTRDYVQEERRDLPPRAEVEAFYEDLAELRDRVDRAAARTDLLDGDR